MAWSSTSRMRMTAPRPFTLPLSLATRLALAPYRVAGTACDWILGKRPEPEQGRRLPGSARSPHAGGQDGDAPRTVPAAQGRRFCARRPRALQFQSFFRADVAQLAEHITRNDGVLGSIPSVGSKNYQHTATFSGGLFFAALAVCYTVCYSSSREPAEVIGSERGGR